MVRLEIKVIKGKDYYNNIKNPTFAFGQNQHNGITYVGRVVINDILESTIEYPTIDSLINGMSMICDIQKEWIDLVNKRKFYINEAYANTIEISPNKVRICSLQDLLESESQLEFVAWHSK